MVSCSVNIDSRPPRLDVVVFERGREQAIFLDIPLCQATDNLYHKANLMNEWPGQTFDEFWVDADQVCFCIKLRCGLEIRTEPLSDS